MKKILRWLGMLAVGAAMQGGLTGVALAQGAPPTASTGGAGAAPEGYQGSDLGQSVITSPIEAEPGTELPVLFVTSVEILRAQTPPQLDIVRVTGLTGSQGWSSPQLVPTYIGKPLDGILDLQFIATMPLQTEADAVDEHVSDRRQDEQEDAAAPRHAVQRDVERLGDDVVAAGEEQHHIEGDRHSTESRPHWYVSRSL